MATTETPIWECDGCGLLGTEEELVEHITETNEGKELADITCWGSMLVGSECWLDYHIDGIHPMATLMLNMFNRRNN